MLDMQYKTYTDDPYYTAAPTTNVSSTVLIVCVSIFLAGMIAVGITYSVKRKRRNQGAGHQSNLDVSSNGGKNA